MTTWQIVGLSVGTLILVALALGVPCSPLRRSPCPWHYCGTYM
jgi:hypothetical protein